MNIFRVFGLCRDKILAKNVSTRATVTAVRTSCLHVVKKPVRMTVTEQNTIFSHYIMFEYTVNGIAYKGTLYVDLKYRCPQKGETIDVYYDPENPRQYACYAFGPAGNPIGW